jgi:hypothetical protein
MREKVIFVVASFQQNFFMILQNRRLIACSYIVINCQIVKHPFRFSIKILEKEAKKLKVQIFCHCSNLVRGPT